VALRVGGFVAEPAKLLEGVFLGGVEVFRDLDADPNVEVAPSAPGKGGNALIAKTEDFVGGGSGGNPEFEFSIEAGNADFRSQSQLSERDRHLTEKILFLPLKDGMRGNREDHIKIPGFSPSRTGLALSGGAKAGSGVHPGGNL